MFSIPLLRRSRAKHCVKSIRIPSYSGPYSVRMRENTDQNNSKYEHFLRSEDKLGRERIQQIQSKNREVSVKNNFFHGQP